MLQTLRITADDFGLTPGVTDGILQAFEKGIVTHTSVLVGGLDFDRTVNLAREKPGLGVGVHLCSTMGRPALSASKVPSLVDADGRFFLIKSFVFRALLGRLDKGQLLSEWSAQIERVLEADIQPTHVDSHHHIHQLPFCFSVVRELVKKYKIPYVRRPVERWDRLTGMRSMVKRFCFRVLCARSWPAQTSDTFFGLPLQEHPDYAEVLGHFVRNLPHGLCEVMVHPGIEDETLRRIDQPFHHGREIELKSLCNPILSATLKKNGICLDRPKLSRPYL